MPVFTDFATGALRGDVVESRRTVRDLGDYWMHPDLAREDDRLLYVTQTWFCAPDGTEGAVLWGNTTLMPGIVGDEYFMTRGHWHLKRTHGELVTTISGHGYQVMMGEDGETRAEEMTPGSTHYVPGNCAHRTVNVGEEPLVFLCAWPADCGHDYESLLREGFSRRVLRVGQRAMLVPL
jgi:glucose-6-phosphate isomerase